jgi:hypothetical protein
MSDSVEPPVFFELELRRALALVSGQQRCQYLIRAILVGRMKHPDMNFMIVQLGDPGP